MLVEEVVLGMRVFFLAPIETPVVAQAVPAQAESWPDGILNLGRPFKCCLGLRPQSLLGLRPQIVLFCLMGCLWAACTPIPIQQFTFVRFV